MTGTARTLCQSVILKRGWLKTEIDAKLGEPDLRLPNPRDASGQPMKLWYQARVEAAETDPEHRANLDRRTAVRSSRKKDTAALQVAAEAGRERARMIEEWNFRLEQTRQTHEWAKLVTVWLRDPEFDLSGYQPGETAVFYPDEPTKGARDPSKLFYLGRGTVDHEPVACVSWRLADSAKARAVLARLDIDWTDFLEFNGAPGWFGAETATIKLGRHDEHRLYQHGDCATERYYWD